MANCSGITKDGNVITVDYVAGDGTRGASWSDPYRLVDIYDTSEDNGWGVTVQSGTDFSHYFIPYAVYIQGADTYFLWQEEGGMTETTEVDCFRIDNANLRINNRFEYALRVSNNLITSATEKNIVFNNNGGGSSLIQDAFINQFAIINVYNNITFRRVVINGALYFQISGGVTLEDIIISECFIGVYILNEPASVNRIKIQNCVYGISCGYSSADISNLELINCIYDLRLRNNGTGNVVNFTDCKIDTSTIQKLDHSGDNDVTVNLKSTFKINITNGDGGTATLYDQFGNVVATQTLSGEWEVAGKVLYYKRYYETSGGVESADDITEYYPFSLVVTKTGYQTLTIPITTIKPKIDETNIEGKMEEATQIDADLDAEITTSTGLTGELTTSTGLQAEMN